MSFLDERYRPGSTIIGLICLALDDAETDNVSNFTT